MQLSSKFKQRFLDNAWSEGYPHGAPSCRRSGSIQVAALFLSLPWMLLPWRFILAGCFVKCRGTLRQRWGLPCVSLEMLLEYLLSFGNVNARSIFHLRSLPLVSLSLTTCRQTCWGSRDLGPQSFHVADPWNYRILCFSRSAPHCLSDSLKVCSFTFASHALLPPGVNHLLSAFRLAFSENFAKAIKSFFTRCCRGWSPCWGT